VDVEEYPILNDIELPPDDAAAARPKKSRLDSADWQRLSGKASGL